MARPPGSAIGRYQILRYMARGETSIVYEALEPELGRKVALKILPPSTARDPEQVGYFLRLAGALAGQDHANLLPVVDYGLEDGVPFMASTIAGGGVLADDLPAFSQPKAAVNLVSALAQAVDHLHRNEIIHGRIGPRHVLFDSLDKPLLGGYGRPYKAGDPGAAPAYVAPEQAQGQAPDERCDIYQLGALLHYLVLGSAAEPGSRPEPGTDLPAYQSAGVDDALASVLIQALADDPDARQQSAAELAGQLAITAQRLSAPEVAAAAEPAAAVEGPAPDPAQPAAQEASSRPGRLPLRVQAPTLTTIIMVGLAIGLTFACLVAIFGVYSFGGRLRQPLATAETDTNVRAGPSTDYMLVGVLRQGQEAVIHGISPDGRWWQIEFAGAPGDKGWVSSAFVTVDQMGNIDVVEPPPLGPSAAAPLSWTSQPLLPARSVF